MDEHEKGHNLEEFDISEVPSVIPLLPVRDVVIFPYMILPLFVGREKSIRALQEALSTDRLILVVTQKSPADDELSKENIYPVGTLSQIIRMLKLPDGRIKILVQGFIRAVIEEITQNSPYYQVRITGVKDLRTIKPGLEVEALIRNVKAQFQRIGSLGKSFSPDVEALILNVEEPGRLADLVISNLDMKTENAQKVLVFLDPVQRLRMVHDLLNKEIELLSMQQKIQLEAREEMEKTQKEYYLREQMRVIQKELGETDHIIQEIQELAEKIEKANMPAKVHEEAIKQLHRLEKMHPDSPESTTIRAYLEWMIELPWGISTKDKMDVKSAAKILNKDHYDLEKIKERILEYLSVLKLKKDMKGPILCFVGPPGVGKTSLGKSIAKALGRKFVRMSLGGIRDEAEIRGHRRTYVGALPGRIIQGVRQAGTNNPVFIMDEIDKVGIDFRGDPSSALLEVLDPEQNSEFRDNYLGVPFDLSNVMFIMTANMVDSIIPALQDRMEILQLPGYTEEEKFHIAKKFLLPKQLKAHGITSKNVTFSDRAIQEIITGYTREAGVRNLEREIASICRKVAKKMVEGKGKSFRINTGNLQKYLGIQKYLPEIEQEKDGIGIATGLAWTPAGGEIMHVEATIMHGKGSLMLTGHLGDIMKESAQAALSCARSQMNNLNLEKDFYTQHDIHIHVPSGAIPKDGPSAGITMATALISTLANMPVNRKVAMTGEVTLRGNVLPVGGLKEKILAARRAGIKTIIIPNKNKKDLEELASHVKRSLNFVFAETMEDVLKVALLGGSS
jgi:ATP-dependent Lon protease